jgi:hypothetical protein
MNRISYIFCSAFLISGCTQSDPRFDRIINEMDGLNENFEKIAKKDVVCGTDADVLEFMQRLNAGNFIENKRKIEEQLMSGGQDFPNQMEPSSDQIDRFSTSNDSLRRNAAAVTSKIANSLSACQGRVLQNFQTQSTLNSDSVLKADNVGDLAVRPENVGVGSKISCNWKGLGTFYSGTVTSRDGDNISVQYDDGDFERTTIQCIKGMGMPKREELKPKKVKSTQVRADYEICSKVISGSRNFFDQISVSIGVSSKNIEIVGGVYGGAGDRCKINVMTPLGPMNCNSGLIYTDNGGRSYYTRGTEIGVNNSCSKI